MNPKLPAAALLGVILAASFALKLNHLDHAAVKPLDEAFHALVARNLLKHPLTPTLVDHPFIPTDDRSWLSSHIWLHKPPMALWQIAASFKLLGVSTLALRLPSAILSTLAVWLTYLIARQFFDPITALIAAALQAFNPVILMIVQGYVFSDHVDISLLFWTELSILFLFRAIRTGRNIDLILCGAAQGFAFLSKTFPALIVTGLAVAALLLPILRLTKKSDSRLTLRGLLLMLLFTAIITLPWLIFTALRFPTEFHVEYLGILHHLSENVENFAAPWDQLVFNYWITIFFVFYPAIIAAAVVILIRAIREKQLGLWLILAWAAGVMVPNLLATSKPMTATLIGWPAAWILFAYMISRALRKDRLADHLALGVWLASMLLAVICLSRTSIPNGAESFGQTAAPFSIMAKHLWLLWQVLLALAAGLLFQFLPVKRNLHVAVVAICTAAMLLLALCWWKGNHPRGYVYVAWQVTQSDAESPSFTDLGIFAQSLPPNAAFLVDEHQRLENKVVEFATDRSCYPATSRNWSQLSDQLTQAGAIPYLLTPAPLPLPIVYVNTNPPMFVYACPRSKN